MGVFKKLRYACDESNWCDFSSGDVSVKTKMNWGLVTYGSGKATGWGTKCITDRFPDATLWVVNNGAGKAVGNELQGTNEFFEFSGYAQLIEAFKAGKGPFVIANDTFFKTHQTRLWLVLLKRILGARNPLQTGMVYGDIRIDGNALSERPNPFWASWIFVIPDVATLLRFEGVLQQVMAEGERPLSEAYKAFFEAWLQPRKRWGGWHGQATEAALRRKRSCIVMEHRLSYLWVKAGYEIGSIGAFYPRFYGILRILDRLKTRWQAWVD